MSPAWWEYRETVTVADVLEEGACVVGVLKWVKRNKRIAGDPVSVQNKFVKRASRANGYGDGGYGYGDGGGYGYGYGEGDGYDENAFAVSLDS